MNNKNTTHWTRLNDHSHSSGKYHKKDGTPRRAILKLETQKLVTEELR